jgi:hypothetical protein
MWEQGKHYKPEVVPQASARVDLQPAPWKEFLAPTALRIGDMSHDIN